MWDTETLALVLGTFLFAGLVKGVVGFGIPIVALALLVNTLGLKTAIALIVAPGIVMNLWQAAVGGNFRAIVARVWPMLVMGCAYVWIGVSLLARADARVASAMLGVLLALYAVYGLVRPQLTPPRAWEPWLTPVVGAFSGIAYGFSGSLMIPGVVYLQALGFNRNMLVQSLGITFLLMTSVLGLSLSGHNLLPRELALLSVLALVPTWLGMVAGQRVRHRLSEERFRTIFFWALMIAGLYMVVRATV